MPINQLIAKGIDSAPTFDYMQSNTNAINLLRQMQQYQESPERLNLLRRGMAVQERGADVHEADFALRKRQQEMQEQKFLQDMQSAKGKRHLEALDYLIRSADDINYGNWEQFRKTAMDMGYQGVLPDISKFDTEGINTATPPDQVFDREKKKFMFQKQADLNKLKLLKDKYEPIGQYGSVNVATGEILYPDRPTKKLTGTKFTDKNIAVSVDEEGAPFANINGVLEPYTAERHGVIKNEPAMSADQRLTADALEEELGRPPTKKEISERIQKNKMDITEAWGRNRAKAYADERWYTMFDRNIGKTIKVKGYALNEDTDNRYLDPQDPTLKSDTQSLAKITKGMDAISGFEKGASQALDFALSMAKDYKSGKYPGVNRVSQLFQYHIGNPKVKGLWNAITTATTEYMKVINAGSDLTAAELSVMGQQRAKEIIEGADNIESIANSVKIMKREMQISGDKFRAQRREVLGRIGPASNEAPTQPQPQPSPEQVQVRKQVNGKWYVKKDGKWYEE